MLSFVLSTLVIWTLYGVALVVYRLYFGRFPWGGNWPLRRGGMSSTSIVSREMGASICGKLSACLSSMVCVWAANHQLSVKALGRGEENLPWSCSHLRFLLYSRWLLRLALLAIGPIISVTPDEIKIKDIAYYDSLYSISQPRDKHGPSASMAGVPLSGNHPFVETPLYDYIHVDPQGQRQNPTAFS